LLRSYRKDWDEERGVWRDTPRHDSASHGSDALQTLACFWREARQEDPPESLEARKRREHAEHAKAMAEMTKPRTLNELLDDYDDELARAEG
jgi:hypothetical protein